MTNPDGHVASKAAANKMARLPQSRNTAQTIALIMLLPTCWKLTCSEIEQPFVPKRFRTD